MDGAEVTATTSLGGTPVATTTANRLGNLDVLRAVAALLVLVGHAYALGGRFLPVTPQHWYDAVFIQSTSGVWLFFVLSGYLIGRPFLRALVRGERLPSPLPYAVKRALRIYPLYWCTFAFVVLVVGAGATHSWQYLAHLALLQNLVPGRQEAIMPVAWTLTLEMLFYATVPVLAYTLRRRRRGPIAAATLATWIACTWVASIAWMGVGTLVIGTNGVWLREVMPGMWQMFCPGLLLALAVESLDGSRWRFWLVELPRRRGVSLAIAGAMVLTGAVLASIVQQGWGARTSAIVYSSSRPFYAVGFGLVVAVAIRAKPWHERVGNWLLELGLISYGIYLLHATFAYALLTKGGNRFIPMHHGGVVAGVVHIGFLVVLTVPAAWVSWRVLERPLVARAHRIARAVDERKAVVDVAAATTG